MPLVSIDYTALFPTMDLEDRYGFFNGIGISIDFKTKKNFIYGLHSNFFFGGIVRQTEQFSDIVNSNGTVTNIFGSTGDAQLKMRGFNVNFDFGYLFTFKKPNPNSGLFVKIGGGFLHNVIYIQNQEQNIPQINGDYKKGYDFLSMGANLSQHIGYQFIHNKGIWNFHVGLYVMEGLTKNIRYIFYYKSYQTKLQWDIMYGIKVGWTIPIYKRTPDKFYYN